MDVTLWILIGLAGGLTVAALAPEMGLPSRSAAARRYVRGMATGLVGAVAAGYALVLADPAVRSDRLAAGVGALAGALWLAWIVEVYSSRRRRGEGGGPPAPEHGGAVSAIAMPAHDAMRQALVDGLIEDALAHEAGRGTRRSADSSPPFVTAPHARSRHGTRGFSSRCASGMDGPRHATSAGARARPSSRSRWRTGRGLRERSRPISRWTATPWTPRSSVDSPT